jgi:hypothetical protein
MRFVCVAFVLAFMLASCTTGEVSTTSDTGADQYEVKRGGDLTRDIQHDTSPRLGGMTPQAPRGGEKEEMPRHVFTPPDGLADGTPDPVAQTAMAFSVATNLINFAGVGNGDYGFAPDAAPPDTNGAVGTTQYVQWVNESFAIFDKSTGALQYGPAAGRTLWQGFGGGCETNNDGDPIVLFDKVNQRWIWTQFSVSSTPYLQCVAVSTTSDATGTWNRYAFQQPNFPDYPKLSVWPDAYYITYNMFSGNSFQGARACAMDSAAMMTGGTAAQVCFSLSTSFSSLLPSDLDGTTTPPSGSPNLLLNFGTNSLNLWQFHIDFANPANSTFAGPTNIAVAAFSPACSGGACVPQAGTRQRLDSLADRLMYRLAYRNFGTRETLLVSHSVRANGNKRAEVDGIRWYELRNPAGGTMGTGTPVVFQQGTYAPDGSSRWMSSIAMDKQGNIAVGYSVSSGSLHPAIRYATRSASDPLGTLQGETSIVEGGGSQQRSLNRWGDYSAMTVDPSDDCTFWYTNEYLKADGTYNWSTRIASFKVPTCQ